MIQNKNQIIIAFLLLFFLVGCTKSTSVIIKTDTQGKLEFGGFGRGQSILGLQCVACPHFGAIVNVTTLRGQLICSGVNELIVNDVSNNALAVGCPGLENYENQSVHLQVTGFAGQTSAPEQHFEMDTVVTFGKVK